MRFRFGLFRYYVSVFPPITLFMSGFIVDEYNLGGDAQSFCMFIAIGCISGLNLIIYYRRKQ